MKQFLLTDAMIHNSFDKTGIDMKYFAVYEAEAKRCYQSLQDDCPDDEDTTEDDNNALSSLALTDDYIKFYVQEAEKGHNITWCESVARDSSSGEHKIWVVRNALEKIEDDKEKENELSIHAHSLNSDPIFVKRYVYLIHEIVPEAKEKAEDYCKAYHKCIKNGKSEIYAHAYADAVNEDFYPDFCEMYARAYELAVQHGMDDLDAHFYGDFCTDALVQGLWLYMDDYLKKYNKEWQVDFLIEILYEDIKEEKHRDLHKDECEEIKNEVKWHLNKIIVDRSEITNNDNIIEHK